MLHSKMAAALENIEEARNVALGIEPRMDKRMAHTGLGGEVDDVVGTVLLKDARDGGLVGDVCAVEGESRLGGEQAKAGLFECRIIIVVEVVQAVHGVTIVQKALYDVKADEAGCAGDEHHVI